MLVSLGDNISFNNGGFNEKPTIFIHNAILGSCETNNDYNAINDNSPLQVNKTTIYDDFTLLPLIIKGIYRSNLSTLYSCNCPIAFSSMYYILREVDQYTIKQS